MRKLGFSRTATMLLALSATLVLLAAFGLAALLLRSRTAVGANALLATPVRWDSLPAPVTTRPEWTSYAAMQPVHDLAFSGALLWAATDGGVVAWDTRRAFAPTAVRFGVEHGLPANRVRALAVGPDGRIWVGTQAGVAVYDGTAWQRFTGADDPGAVPVNDLLVQRDGAVWAATDAGLSRYDGARWRTTTAASLLAGLPADRVTALAEAPGNQIWAGTDAGLVLTDGRRWQVVTTADGLNSNAVTALANAPDGTLWAGTEVGLNRFDGRTWDSYLLAEPFAGRAPAALAVRPDGSVLVGFGANAAGLAQVDPDAARPVTTVVERAGDAVHALALDGSGGLWMGTAVGVERQTAGGWQSFTPPSELPDNRVAGLLLAADGLWAATPGGAARYDGRWQTFTRGDGLIENDVRALAAGPDGGIWAAHGNPLLGFSRLLPDGSWVAQRCALDTPPSRRVTAGALAADGAIWLTTDNGAARVQDDAWDHVTTADGLQDNDLRALAIAPDGAVWVGGPAGLSVLRGGRWEQVNAAPVEALTIAPDGTIWLLTAGAVARLDGTTLAPAPPLPATVAVRALAATDAALWAATDSGVARLENAVRLDAASWQLMTTGEGLPGTNVTAVARDADNRIWAATNGSFEPGAEGEPAVADARLEIVWFDGQRWRLHPQRDAAAEVLSNNQVADILATPDGAIWFATAAGIDRLQDGIWTAFAVAGEGSQPGAAFALAYAFDTVWALTDAGLVQFTPQDGGAFVPFGGASAQGDAPPATLHVAPSGALWVTTADFAGGIRVFDGLAWRTLATLGAPARLDAAAFDADGRFWVAGQNLSDNTLFFGFYDPVAAGWTWRLPGTEAFPARALAFAPDGTLWLGSAAGQGIEVRDVAAGDLDRVIRRFAEPANPDVIHFAADGTALVGSGDTLWQWDGRGWRQDEAPIPFMNAAWDVETAPDGAVWVGSAQGAARRTAGWETFYAPVRTPGWWNDISVMAVRPDGGIAVGTSSGGVGLYTGRAYLVSRPDAWRGQSFPIRALFNTPEGDLWVGTDGAGAAVLTDTGWRTLAPDAALTAAVSGLGFTNDGTAWVGTPVGLLALTPDAAGSCRLVALEGETAVTGVLRGRDGRLWLGTENAGALTLGGLNVPPEVVWPDAPARVVAQGSDGTIWVVNARQDWLNYRSGDSWQRVPLRRDLLTAGEMTALAVDRSRTVWIGTGRGLFVFNGRDWRQLTTADGLPDNAVDGIVVAPDGAVWVATAGGIGRYRP